jgi:galactose mutarotase-like enzyme
MKNNIITIENENIKAQINLFGGAFYSLIDKETNEQLLWQGDEKWWGERDLVLFPFACRRKDGFYTINGVRYDMPIHGFAKDSVFTVESVNDDSVVITLESDDKSRKIYPYDFIFKIEYALNGKSVAVKYSVFNKDDKEMYFSVGGHFGVRLNAQTGNFVRFSKAVTEHYPLDGLFVKDKERLSEKLTEVELNKALMKKYATLICANDGKNSLTFERKGGKDLKFTYDSPAIAFWSNPDGGDYYCVEVWWGLPDEAEVKREIADKKLMYKLNGKQTFSCGYEIEIL